MTFFGAQQHQFQIEFLMSRKILLSLGLIFTDV